jgi:glycosyltransferase involved in cell wall biosynthesis
MTGPAVFCSVIIPTIGRSSLARAVESVLAQECGDAAVELIVVNDSGRPLEPAPWQTASRVQVLMTQQRKAVVARNTGAAAASGRYLLFLDDDDWLAAGALAFFYRAAQEYPEAGCIFGSFDLVDEACAVLEHHRLGQCGNVAAEVVSGRWLQVASVLIRADVFFAAGGFSPRFPISEELDLMSRLAILTDFAGGDTVVAHIYRGISWQTSVDYTGLYEYNRLLRDRALAMPKAFSRLWQSAGPNPYWHGRITRLYLTAMVWNWRKRCITRGASRGAYAFRSVLGGPHHLLAAGFWRGLRDDLPAVQTGRGDG